MFRFTGGIHRIVTTLGRQPEPRELTHRYPQVPLRYPLEIPGNQLHATPRSQQTPTFPRQVGAVSSFKGRARTRSDGDPARVLQGSGAEAGVLARFVAAQLLRTPTMAGHMHDIDEHLRPFLFTLELLKAEGLNAADLSAAEMYQWQMAGTQMAETHSTPVDENSRLRTIMRTFDGFATALSGRSWTVLAATDDLLITGDAPVVTLKPLQSGWKGLLPPGAPVLMPITPTRLLVGEENPLGQDDVLRPQLARAVNEEVAANADDAIIKAPSSTWPTYLDLASARPKLPPPKITIEASQAPPTQLTYPAISDPTVKDLLKQLGAQSN
ncbi:DUF4238 domain-containing protein [Kribbella sp. NPDC050241]|uniref:DUF4238 domain-containing protein n=1 Tax=Kribbella sp. NPDC050241 TaxID=3364115 RepID=UPI0037B6E8FE